MRTNLQQFFDSDPRLVHCLTELDETRTRPLNWFQVSDSRLLEIGRNLGLRGVHSQEGIRKKIGWALYYVDSSVAEFAHSVEASSDKKMTRILEETVG